MNILVCGADGFIGRHICSSLAANGHTVRRGVRRPREDGDIAIDYAEDHDAEVWLPRLAGIDVVINAIGILIESSGQRFAAIHVAAPQALFTACASKSGVRVIQVSALGVEQGKSAYFSSKLAAERHLAALDLDWAILRPGLVYGLDGASSRLFRMLASLPLVGLPGRGEQPLQLIHIDDLCACVQRLVEAQAPMRRSYELSNGDTLSYRKLLQTYRKAMGLGRALFIPIPLALMRIAARLAELLPQRVLSRDTLSMLEDGNTTTTDDARHLLARDPIRTECFITPALQTPLRQEAVSAWAIPLLQITLAIMWIVTALCSHTQQELSLDLLAAVGIHGYLAVLALYAAVALDLVLGLLTLWRPGRSLWLAQIALILTYTAILTLKLPEFWSHPFGPLLKNLPILAVLLFLFSSTPARSHR